ncbi:hypothetical protein EB796_001451 [Bugula neritina]|uniref:Gamma-secretase-activating protein C-terminal domain-containing protein n=1 Tax=Bugula neritina TaxID=10212 RepID=A0A7J7KQ00_BUGNE|nr:hypothetical protein EB796_001451 [Bugula neritina]
MTLISGYCVSSDSAINLECFKLVQQLLGAGRRNGVEERDGRKDDRQQITIQTCNCSCQHIEVSNENALKRNSEFFPFLHLLKRKRAVKRFRVEELSRRMVSDESAIKKKTPSIIDSLRNIIRNQSVATGGTQFSERDRAGSLYSYNAVTFPDSLLNEDVDDKFVTNLANAIHEYVRKVYPLASGKISGIKGGKASPLSTVDIKKQELITMCWTYAKILLNQVKVLLHHLYNVFGLNQLHNMQQPDDLLKAFHLLERYMFAVNKLGLPLPDEFATLFTTLAYQSHTPEEFMQYVNCGLVELTDGFLDVLAADKNIIKAPVKGECLALLPQPQALKWSHKLMESVGVAATATRLVAENLLSKYYNGRNSSGQGNLRRMSLTASSGGEVEESNPDLPQSYSHLVSRMTRAGWREDEEGSLTAPMLERAVFYYTTAEC